MKPEEISIAENTIYNLVELAMFALYSEIGEKKFSDLKPETQKHLMFLQKGIALNLKLSPEINSKINTSIIYPDSEEMY